MLESAVDHLVGEVLHATQQLDGDGLSVLPQPAVRARMGGSVFTAHPDFIVRDVVPDPLIHVVAHNTSGDKLCWAQVGAAMLIAALSNTSKLALQTGTMHMVGIRAQETRFTFFKAAFGVAALMRLRHCESTAGDHFPISCWGGAVVDRIHRSTGDASSVAGRENQRAETALSRQWGLDFRVAAEREQIVRMLLALRQEIYAQQHASLPLA